MKKIIVLALCVMLSISAIGCASDKKKEEPKKQETESKEKDTTQKEKDDTEEIEQEETKTTQENANPVEASETIIPLSEGLELKVSTFGKTLQQVDDHYVMDLGNEKKLVLGWASEAAAAKYGYDFKHVVETADLWFGKALQDQIAQNLAGDLSVASVESTEGMVDEAGMKLKADTMLRSEGTITLADGSQKKIIVYTDIYRDFDKGQNMGDYPVFIAGIDLSQGQTNYDSLSQELIQIGETLEENYDF